MSDWRKALMPPHATLREAMAVIDSAGLQIGLVTDAGGRLLGTVTDGDLRRAILRGRPLEDGVDGVMNARPVTAPERMARDQVLDLMQARSVRQIVLLDADRRVVDLKSIEEMVTAPARPNWVVLQAGGLGTRLRPLTSTIPKPMLQVGKRPILETILQSFRNAGFSHFYIAVNYKREQIKEHFGDGSAFGVQIRYLEEEEPLGTAGALGLLPEMPREPVIVMNADLLTSLSFGQLLDFHLTSGASATLCTREYDVQIPFGVIDVESSVVVGIREKPIESFRVNAGVYVLNPEAIGLVPHSQSTDMPDLLNALIEADKRVAVFPIREYWLDIGRHDDLAKANLDYDDVFE
jgi:dTDP-glucose pyrophosphorylase